MRVLMTGGGTGGHINPAIAIANTIKKHHPDAVIEFVASTRPSDKASDLVPRAGYKLHRLDICRSYRFYDPRILKTAYYMSRSEKQAKKLISEFAPDIIIGTGGFACYPVANAGAKMGIPTLLHESNALPGKAIRRLAPRVDGVMVNFEASKEILGRAKRVIHVGNPVILYDEQARASGAESKYARSVLSFGGSRGAPALNLEMARAISALCDKYPNVEFCHASGKDDHENTVANFAALGLDKKPNVRLSEYIYDMGTQMSRADVVISRAGAMTLSELALESKAAILVPLPTAADNHQYLNAKNVADIGGCILIEEKDFDGERLTYAIDGLLQSPARRREMGEKFSSLAIRDANEVIYNEIIRLKS